MFLNIIATITVILCASSAFCASMVGSKHDLRAVTGTTEICKFCHAAHNNKLYEALWTKDPTVFRLYSAVDGASRTFKTGLTADSKSLICMACHDGSVVGAHPYQIQIPVGGTNFGTQLTASHPINFQVTEYDTQKDLWVSGEAYTGKQMGRLDGKPYTLYTINGNNENRRGSRSLECSSCHNTHDPEYKPFLRDTMFKSRLCLGCHNK